MAKKTTELAPVSGGYGYLSNVNLGEALSEELSGLTLTFDRVKIPSGGGIVFELPGESEDDPDMSKEFSGVILYHHQIRSYYKTEYNGGNNPPDCGSYDGHTGVGDPGGDCHSCPLDAFGTAANGNGGKACKERRRLYVLVEGEVFPLLYSLPSGSLKPFSTYIRRLLSKGKRSVDVLTRFSLSKAVNSTGLAYSEAAFAVARDLTSEEKTLVSRFAGEIKTLAAHVNLQADADNAAGDAAAPEDGTEPL